MNISRYQLQKKEIFAALFLQVRDVFMSGVSNLCRIKPRDFILQIYVKLFSKEIYSHFKKSWKPDKKSENFDLKFLVYFSRFRLISRQE